MSVTCVSKYGLRSMSRYATLRIDRYVHSSLPGYSMAQPYPEFVGLSLGAALGKRSLDTRLRRALENKAIPHRY